ncbi:MAG: hypothetical protein AMXMBFR13_33660 [Phycisphaerae bacterium]
MPSFQHDGLSFNYLDAGTGVPFVFQHGLGGDVNQPFGLFSPPDGVRLLAFDCRAHGETRPVGPPDKISFASFADDLAAFLDDLGVSRAVVGGISMGAGVALNFCLRYPQRTAGLVLSRPAWTHQPLAQNVQMTAFMAGLIRRHGAREGQEVFRNSPELEEVARAAPDVANSLLRQFENPRAEETVIKLERIPPDAPCRSLKELESITVPTLVMVNARDPVHPAALGKMLADAIPGAQLLEITSKSISCEQHTIDVQNTISTFLVKHFNRGAL